jgi:hypothetical protein
MSTDQVRETMESYAEALLASADYRRFFAEAIELEAAAGAEAAHPTS